MSEPLDSVQPAGREVRRARRRLGWKQELLLALLPTATVLALVEAFSSQRLLFASLASSAFLIYLAPEHGTNRTRTLLIAQLGASVIGYVAFQTLGPGYHSAAVAMVVTIALMIIADAVHPPAVATTLSFAFKASTESNLLLFACAVGLVVILVILQRSSLWPLARFRARDAMKS